MRRKVVNIQSQNMWIYLGIYLDITFNTAVLTPTKLREEIQLYNKMRPLSWLLLCALLLLSCAQVTETQQTIEERTLEQEANQVKAIGLKYQHIKTYSFLLENNSSFALRVDHDVEIKAVFTVYWGDTSAYRQSTYMPGEKVWVEVFEEGGAMLFSGNCYHTSGLKFPARKDHSYLIHFRTQGKKKMISMMMENYISERKGAEKLHSEHMHEHEEQTTKVRHKMKSFLTVLERNAAMSQQVAQNAASHSRGYKKFQIGEMLLIVLGACAQMFMLKKLVGPSVL